MLFGFCDNSKGDKRIKNTGIPKYLLLAVTLAVIILPVSLSNAQTAPKISNEDFRRMLRDISEYGGYFPSDNWVSNEITYLNVLGALEENEIKGGVYIGVSADQNFTYINAIKPELVFIVDIRNQNRMQHLFYKSAFELSETRAEFFSMIFSKPLDPDINLNKDGNIAEIVDYFYGAPSDRTLLEENKEKIVDHLATKFGIEVLGRDNADLMYVMTTLFMYNMRITYNGPQRSWYPTMGRLLQMVSIDGNYQSIFNSNEDYRYIRNMHLQNKILPVTGDFGGSGALQMIAEFLKEHNLTVTAYYTSNVEQYLLQRRASWIGWLDNVKNLPITDKTVFIRWTHDGRGYNQATRLQWMKTFIKNAEEGRYYSYYDLISLDYIKNR